jgi:hypothetical protein
VHVTSGAAIFKLALWWRSVCLHYTTTYRILFIALVTCLPTYRTMARYFEFLSQFYCFHLTHPRIIQVRTCSTKHTSGAYYGKVREMHGTAPGSIHACHTSGCIHSQTGFVSSSTVPNLQQKTLWSKLDMMYHVQQVSTHRFCRLRNWALSVSFVWQQKQVIIK